MSSDVSLCLEHCMVAYLESMQGSIFDKAIDMAYPVYEYLVLGKKPVKEITGEFTDEHTASGLDDPKDVFYVLKASGEEAIK